MTQPQREWFEKDYYKVLGVSESASDKEITKAYRKLAKENHPDSHPGREDTFKEISSAYAVLSDPEKRKSYDEVRRMGPGAMGGGFGPGGFSPGGFQQGDLSDLLGGLFGQRKTGRRNVNAPRRGEDLEASLTLSFEEAVAGATTSVTLVGDGSCSTCDGTGAAPGTSAVVCSNCGGRGTIDSNQGFFSFSQPCTSCSGTGMRVERPCPTCGGSGAERKGRNVKVRIPAGVENGQRIRLKSRGNPGRNGGPPGDLYVTVHVGAHSMFGRRGKDLTITVPITFAEAVLGATISVPTLNGPVQVKVPAGVRSGQTIRARGKGARSSPSSTDSSADSDLLVTVEIAVPKDPTDAERDALAALARASSARNPRAHLGV
jgi:molecular chaperone DnaJ